MEQGELDADPAEAASALAFAELQAVEVPLPKYRTSALGRLGRTEEAETETHRAYRTGQNPTPVPAQPEPRGHHRHREQGRRRR
ncbi:hypothetical protein GCM10010387_50130 [Streptomyces inusitatus]|uniref:Uncharacterized protein n=1 Tax=Streptomyces inusitatus TaxID=68221 RepID=A0A918QJY9_9ACTN|nr:hypothetical protein GCM10010387_50130 [Streptomyces inusitatus]